MPKILININLKLYAKISWKSYQNFARMNYLKFNLSREYAPYVLTAVTSGLLYPILFEYSKAFERSSYHRKKTAKMSTMCEINYQTDYLDHNMIPFRALLTLRTPVTKSVSLQSAS